MDLSQEEWTKKLQSDNNAVVIDVRTPEEWSDGIIANAIKIDIYRGQHFIDEISVMDKSVPYYVYCKAGGRSAQACALLNQLGFEHAYNLVGGIMQWNGDLTDKSF